MSDIENENWDANPIRVYDEVPNENLNTYVRVNGSDLPLTPGASFAATVKEVARDSGLGKFRVYVNGAEMKPADAPDTIEEGMSLEMRAYDVAGGEITG